MSTIREQINALAQKGRAKIGIGLLNPTPSIVDSLNRAKEFTDIVTIGAAVKGFENIPADKDTIEIQECEALFSKQIEGLIRGQADTYRFEDALAKRGEYDRSRLSPYMLFEDQFERSFFSTSGSHGDGWRIPQKKNMVDDIVKQMKLFGVTPKLGFLTWVRPGSVGRNFFFDATWDTAEELVAHYKNQGFEAKNYNIEIETALNDGVNCIVFANGTSGNMLARALSFLVKDALVLYGYAGIKESIVENNRTLQNYYNQFLYAAAQVNRAK